MCSYGFTLRIVLLYFLLVENIIQFRFNVGNGIQVLERITAYPLNDDMWHTVHVERNRKQAMLKVDQQAPVFMNEPIDQSFKPLNLNSPLVIGEIVLIILLC